MNGSFKINWQNGSTESFGHWLFQKIVYEPSKITIWPQFINCLNDKELFVNFFELMSFTQGNFTNFDKKWPKSDS